MSDRRARTSGRSAAFLIAALLFTALPGASVSRADEPPAAPLLRIDPVDHTGMIRRIAVDAGDRWLVTASDDKTARVWDLASGRLLTTLRPPVDVGNDGKLNAVAMTPDGSTVAVGGWTGYAWDKQMSIYLFDRASGRLLRRIAGVVDVLNHLAFTPDGRLLVASLHSKGIRLYDAADGRQLAEDTDYAGGSYSAHASPDGRRLVTTCEDNHLRLYNIEGGRLVLLAKAAPPGGRDPVAARFSPDGKRIVVGFYDTPNVVVVDATNLRTLFSPDTSGLTGSFGSVAWSRDGTRLMAAGTVTDKDDLRYIRRWPVRGNEAGRASDFPVARDVVTDLVPLAGGSVAYASGEPTWGVLGADGQRPLVHGSPEADYRNLLAGFTLSADGTRVRFGYEVGGASPVVFDVVRRGFLADEPTGMAAPVFSAPGITVNDWKNTTAPKFGDTPIKLSPYESARSVAMRPAQGGFVLGADWSLRAFDRRGQQLWYQVVPGATWALNVSGDGRWVVAGYGDGTIRWHRAEDGEEQLAFYPHPDRKRWVLWTPSGYYDASPGAEDLIGWHLNRGKAEAADFFPASRFRDRFHRPDVVARVLESGTEVQAVKLADAESGRRKQATDIQTVLPPVVTLVTPAEGQRFGETTLRVRYRVRTTGDAPVTGVKVLVDGRPLETARGLRPVAEKSNGDGQEFTLEVAVPGRDLALSLIAENRHGASDAKSVRLVWNGQTADMLKPRLYVLSVGVANYRDASMKLTYPAKDAADLAKAFERQSGLYREVRTKVLPDATADEVLEGLDWLRAEVTAKDVGVLFLAGHGVNDADGDYYFLPSDANTAKLSRTAVSYLFVRKVLSALPGKTLAFIDTCHSGNIMGARRGGADIDGLVNDLTSAENGIVVFASSTGRQYSLEDKAWGNGAFTKALVEGLGGKADLIKDGAITINELDAWLADRVKQLTRNQQTPTTTKPSTVPDFPVMVTR